MKLNWVESLVIKFFKWLGHQTARRPWFLIFGPILIGMCFILMAGSKILISNKLDMISDIVYLYTPYYGVSKHDKLFVDSLFPLNTSSNFDYGDSTEFGYLGLAVVKAKDGGTILRQSVFKEVDNLDKSIRNISIPWGGKYWSFKDLCAKSRGKCAMTSGDYISKKIQQIERGEYKIPYPFYLDIRNLRFEFFGYTLGGVDLDKDGKVESAKSIILIYHLDRMTNDQIERAKLWENKFIESMKKTKLENTSINFFVGHSTEMELRHNVLTVIPYFIPTVTFMIAFCMLTVSLDSALKSKPWLGFTGCSCAIYSVFVGFSICILIGIEFVEINIFITFLILGIGMDDTFMLITAWKQTDSKLTVEERLCKAYSHVGVSITITSLTNLISFLVGSMSPFPSIFHFCTYISVSVACNYIFQITTFGGVMVLFGKLEERNKHSLFFWQSIVPVSEAKESSQLYKFFFVEENDTKDNETFDMKINNFFKNTLGQHLIKPSMKITVILVFIVYISISIYGVTNIKEGLDLKALVRVDSYAHDLFHTMDTYYKKYQVRYQVVLNKSLEYWDPKVEYEIEHMLSKFESMPFMADPSTTWSWLRAYKLFIADDRTKSMLHGLNMTRKEDFITGLKEMFLRFPIGRLFEKDIIFNENRTEIVASRFFLIVYKLEGSLEQKQFYLNILDIKKTLPDYVVVFNQLFPFFDLYTMVKSNTFQSIGLATLVLWLTVLIFMPNITCAICVAFSVISIEVGVMGFMSLIGIKLNGIVMMSLVMCIGLSVDYTAHISYAFTASKERDPNLRVMNALYCTGYPIVQSCISTLIGVAVVFFLPSTTFLDAAVNIALLLLFAVYHSLFLLPTFLSIGAQIFEKSKLDVPSPSKDKPPMYVISSIAPQMNGNKTEISGNGYINQNFDIISETPSSIVIRL